MWAAVRVYEQRNTEEEEEEEEKSIYSYECLYAHTCVRLLCIDVCAPFCFCYFFFKSRWNFAILSRNIGVFLYAVPLSCFRQIINLRCRDIHINFCHLIILSGDSTDSTILFGQNPTYFTYFDILLGFKRVCVHTILWRCHDWTCISIH